MSKTPLPPDLVTVAHVSLDRLTWKERLSMLVYMNSTNQQYRIIDDKHYVEYKVYLDWFHFHSTLLKSE